MNGGLTNAVKAAAGWRSVMALATGAVAGAFGAYAAWWMQGRDTDNIGALIGLIGTVVAVIGWYKSNQLQSDAQRLHLLHQLMNEARLVMVKALRLEQDGLRDISTTLLLVQMTSHPTVDTKMRWIGSLDGYLSRDRTGWIFALEEHVALFPETKICRQQLVTRAIKLPDEIRRIRQNISLVHTGKDPYVREAAVALMSHVHDQSALLEDLCLHLQNRALGAVSGHREPMRQPPDPTVARVVERGGELAIDVEDVARRTELMTLGWLSRHP